jgi:hypothetical protein
MDNRSKGIRLLVAGAVFVLAGLNFWRKGAFDTPMMAVIAGAMLLGGAACLGVGGYLVSQD